MKNFLKIIALVLTSIAAGFSSAFAITDKPDVSPNVNTTWRVHVSTLKANVTSFNNMAFAKGQRVARGIVDYFSAVCYNFVTRIALQTGAVLFEALQIQDTSWSGYAASFMITRAVVGADTVNKKCIMVQDGIKKTFTIPRVEITDFIQPRQPTPTSYGQVTVDGRKLTPLDFMMYYEFDPRDFEEHFFGEELKKELLDRALPPVASQYITLQTMKRLNEFFENSIHRSRIQYNPAGADVNPTTKGEVAGAANFYYFDGLIKKMLDSVTLYPTTPIILVPGAVALTVTNIRDNMTAAINLLPQALIGKYGDGGVKFCMSYYDWLTYGEALRQDPYKNVDSTERAPFNFRGYNIDILAGLPAGTFYLGIQKRDTESNTWLGLNSISDEGLDGKAGSPLLKMEQLQANSEYWFLKGLFKMDTQIGFPDQFVLYTTLTA